MLGVFVVLNVVQFLLVFFLVPETNGAATEDRRTINHMSLEELDHIFEVCTRDFIGYQWHEARPWGLKTAGSKLRLCAAPDSLEVMHVYASHRHKPDEAGNSSEGNDSEGLMDGYSKPTSHHHEGQEMREVGIQAPSAQNGNMQERRSPRTSMEQRNDGAQMLRTGVRRKPVGSGRRSLDLDLGQPFQYSQP